MSIYIFWGGLYLKRGTITNTKNKSKIRKKKISDSINLYDMKHSKESDSMMIKTEASHASLLEFIKNRSVF